MDNRFITPKALRIGIFFFFAIPIGLNFFLMIPTGLNILGTGTPGGSTTLWLQFWAAYLSAAGSFCLAYMSYKVSKETLAENKAMLMKDRWELLIKRYEAIEKFVIDMEYLHTSYNIDIVKTMKQNELKEYYKELSSASLRIIRFLGSDNEFIVNSKREMMLGRYGKCLRELNKKWLEYVAAKIAVQADSSKTDTNADGCKNDIQSDKKGNAKTTEQNQSREDEIQISNLFCPLINLSKDLLFSEKKELRLFAQENEIPCSEFV
jgi:hypothetical protein